MATISELKTALGAGARPNKYRINFSIPSAVSTSSDLSTADALCQATTFPGKTIGQIEVWTQGRKLVIPGDTSFSNTWNVTFYENEDHGLRRDLLAWMKACDDFQVNSHSGNPTAVLGELSVEQLDSAGNATVKYTFHNVFPQDIAEVSLDDSTVDTIQTFDVTFSFTDWVVGDTEEDSPSTATAATKNDTAN